MTGSLSTDWNIHYIAKSIGSPPSNEWRFGLLLVISMSTNLNVYADLEPEIHHKHQWLIHMCTVISYTSKLLHRKAEIQFLSTYNYLLPMFGSVLFSSKKGCPEYFCPYDECTSHWCLVMSFWLKVCILKSHQKCLAGIRTWLSADQSSSSTLTESSFSLWSATLYTEATVMLE